MPKKPSPPESTEPMRMQPLAHAPTAATQMLPLMPGAKAEGKGKTRPPAGAPAEQKKPPTRAEAVRAARARITRRKSLRKQRDAQKG